MNLKVIRFGQFPAANLVACSMWAVIHSGLSLLQVVPVQHGKASFSIFTSVLFLSLQNALIGVAVLFCLLMTVHLLTCDLIAVKSEKAYSS